VKAPLVTLLASSCVMASCLAAVVRTTTLMMTAPSDTRCCSERRLRAGVATARHARQCISSGAECQRKTL